MSVADSTATVERREREQGQRALAGYLEATATPDGPCPHGCGETIHMGGCPPVEVTS